MARQSATLLSVHKGPVTNPYAAQLAAQGKEPSKTPAPKKVFPCTIGARTFETDPVTEYKEALADFLNGI